MTKSLPGKAKYFFSPFSFLKTSKPCTFPKCQISAPGWRRPALRSSGVWGIVVELHWSAAPPPGCPLTPMTTSLADRLPRSLGGSRSAFCRNPSFVAAAGRRAERRRQACRRPRWSRDYVKREAEAAKREHAECERERGPLCECVCVCV